MIWSGSRLCCPVSATVSSTFAMLRRAPLRWGAAGLAPTLTSFSLSNTVFDLGAGPASMTVSIAPMDDLAGVDLDLGGSFGNGSLAFRTVDGAYLRGRGSLPVTGGTATDVTLGFTFDLPESAMPGEYLAQVSLYDRVGNSVVLEAADLEVLGFDWRITVVNDFWGG